MVIRKFVPEDATSVHKIILKSFHEFVAKDCSEAGIRLFESFHSEACLIKRARTCDVLVAEERGEIVGIIARKKDRIFNLFVDKRFHGMGIASSLLKQAEQNAQQEGVVKMRIRSSLYAQKFYANRGYKRSTGVTSAKGVTFQPMIKPLLLAARMLK